MRPTLVRWLGVLGVASAVAFFGAAALAFRPGWEGFGAHFGRWVLLYVYVPLMLLLLYFGLRVMLGGQLLKAGKLREAIAYCEPRLEADFWTRGAREALIHRVVLLRARLQLGELEAARMLITVTPKLSGREALVWTRWAIEAALRVEELVAGVKAFERVASQTRARPQRAALYGARAELALRAGDDAQVAKWLADAAWCDPSCARYRLTQALAWAQQGAARAEQALTWLEDVRAQADREVPTRALELTLVRLRLLETLGRADEAAQARAALRAAYEAGEGDARARRLVAQVWTEVVQERA